jgi:photosystem II stability/assembly factor-like uncharacterized protein
VKSYALITFLLIACRVTAAGQDEVAASALHWRMIGPFRGGRTVGVAGFPDQPYRFLIGVNNGGVWKTDDAGLTWSPVFDSMETGSVGAIAVAPSDPSVVYVGSGEGLQRPDLSVGDGMFRSCNGGQTWEHAGLEDVQQVGAVCVDPGNPDRVYVAALGHPYGPNTQRGLFRTTDGGWHWEQVLSRDENTGAIACVIDPNNPSIVFASLWSSRQGPWENGEWKGATSGLYKSTDGGSTWQHLENGLPSGTDGCGRIGIAVAPANSSICYAMAEAGKNGGLFRSTDAGGHWSRVNSEDRICGRGDDFAGITVDPRNPDVIWSANTSLYRSTDGGRNFTAVKGEPGGDDYHTVWINPLHPEIMIVVGDQGATVSLNAGRTWSSWFNQPTAQLYHVAADNRFPYWVYGGQQESGSVGIASRGNDGRITFREWHPVGADEWASIAPDPLNPDIVYGGKVTRFDRTTGQVQNVAPEAVRSGKYRVLRTAPLLFSPCDPSVLYFAANVVFKTTNGGHEWEIISPDLSREHPEVPATVGVFRTPELSRQDRRGVVYALAASPLDRNLLWAGTDDGLVHITTDGGRKWTDVTPPGVTSWSKVAGIDAGHFSRGTAFVAVNRFRLDDLHPHIYRTLDFGKTWKEITSGLPASGPVNVVREDPVREGLLFAGTERAVYGSLDGGGHWFSLRRNMAPSSVRDVIVHGSDLIAATHGRSFWILDDISPLRQAGSDFHPSADRLFRPDTAFRVRWNLNTDTPLPPEEPAGENPPDGAIIDYYLAAPSTRVVLTLFDTSGNQIRRFASDDSAENPDPASLRIDPRWVRRGTMPGTSAGMHRFVWDLHLPPPGGFPRTYPISAVFNNTASRPLGPFVEPGRYVVRLETGGHLSEAPLVVRMDPRVATSPEALHRQWQLSIICHEGIARLNRAVAQLDSIRIAGMEKIAALSDTAAADSARKLLKKFAVLKGDALPDEDIDAVYFPGTDGPGVRETLNGLRLKYLSLMTQIQSADSDPTKAQVTAVTTEQSLERRILERCYRYRDDLTFLMRR